MPSPADTAAVAESTFGNDEAITSTEFGVPAINPNPTQPDLTSEGQIITRQAVAATTSFTSKTVKIPAKPDQSTVKTVYVESDQAGAFIVEVMLSESELVGGNPVWRTYAGPTALAAGVLAHLTIYDLFRQVRVTVTNGGTPATNVNAWVFSVP